MFHERIWFKVYFRIQGSAHIRAEFNSYVSAIHKDALEQFGTAWKKWLVDNPRTEGEDEEAVASAQNPSGSVFNVGMSDDEA